MIEEIVVKRKDPFPNACTRADHIMNLFHRVYLDVNLNRIQTHKSGLFLRITRHRLVCVAVRHNSTSEKSCEMRVLACLRLETKILGQLYTQFDNERVNLIFWLH